MDMVRAVAFAPTGDELAVGYTDRVEVWVIEGDAKKNPVRKFPTQAPVTALAYSKDGKRLAVGVGGRRCWADGAGLQGRGPCDATQNARCRCSTPRPARR